MYKRPAIRNPHHHALIVRQVRHPDQRSQRQSKVRCSHSILVVHRSIRTLPPGIRRPIPARQSNLGLHRLAMHLRLRSRPRHIAICRRSRTPSSTTRRSRISRRISVRRRSRWPHRHLRLLMTARRQQCQRRHSGKHHASPKHDGNSSTASLRLYNRHRDTSPPLSMTRRKTIRPANLTPSARLVTAHPPLLKWQQSQR
jgi:hypothetical protein